LSYRREAFDRDYPTQHYKDHLHQDEKPLDNIAMNPHQKDAIRKFAPKMVLMDRSYLKGWQIFLQRTKDVPEQMEKMFEE
jgi:hypothetical protein